MKIVSSICVAIVAINVLFASAAPPMVATDVEVFDTQDAFANGFGSIVSDIKNVPSVGALGEDENGQPKIAFLGCRFEVALEQGNQQLDGAVEAINRKIASENSAVPSGAGYLINPTPISITDPVTVTKCDPGRHYPFFIFRRTTMFGSLSIEVVVFEYDDKGLPAFKEAIFNDYTEPLSITTARVVTAAQGLYRINFMSLESIQAESEMGDELLLDLIKLAPMALGGVPIP